MKRLDNGFTLIELMIVVAIIAIIAAIAIPSLLRAKMSANHSNAGAALKSLVTHEGVWRSQDIDQNGVADYWVADVRGFHGAKDMSGGYIKLIDVAFANADMAAGNAYAYPSEAAPATPVPKQGYTFTGDLVAGNSAVPLAGGWHNLPASALHTSAFAFNAVPATYNTDGVLQFLVAQDGVVWQIDKGNNAPLAAGDPAITDPNGQVPPWSQSGG
jgi:prepilin-type N-terminal cleavage/methylation domain-containing protein